MSSNNTTKKRKVDSDESGISLAAVLAEMQEVKSKLSRMDELESRCINMQNEMDGMKSKLSRIDNMQANIDNQKSHIVSLESKCISLEETCSSLQSSIDNKQSQIDKLESKCMHLEDKCGSYEKSIELLKKANNWKYSAPSIPSNYWEEQGFDMNHVTHMVKLVNDFKDTSSWLRRRECRGIGLNLWEDNDNGDPLILQYDNVLLPHWIELANAIHLHQNTEVLDKLSIENLQMPTSILKLLSPALKGKMINECKFMNIRFDNMSDGIEFVVDLIEGLASTERFEWINNVIDEQEHINGLVEAIISHSSIDYIHLENVAGVNINGYEVLCSLLDQNEKSFSHIDVERNNIETGGDTTISDYIAISDRPLSRLYLADNQLNDHDAKLMARALRQNTCLQEIRLGDNNITNIGKEALLKAVYDPTSLNTLADCNHTCSIEGISFDDIITENDCNEGRWTNRSKKIYHLLSNRNKEGSNVQHLNAEFAEDEDSLALKIVPNMLDCIYRYYSGPGRRLGTRTTSRPISIIYEILRGWKMPELYDTKRGNVSGRG